MHRVLFQNAWAAGHFLTNFAVVELPIAFIVSYETIVAHRVLFQNAWATQYFVLLAKNVEDIFGGLKWTRTTDLTLIRRALLPAEL